ncbi:Protein memo1, partial [Clydaea vesicula]
MLKRKSSHAGSWYSDDPKLLQSQLTSLIQKNTTTTQLDSSSSSIKALIVPHAGYSYSANTASFSYSKLNQNTFIKTIFILGPSHHYYLQGCALTQCSEYETPLGNLTVDTDLIKELFETGQFEYMTLDTDENEHSIEMQLPFISFMLKKNLNFKIVPILVGNLTSKNTNILANIFSKYMVDTESMFLISSDFCHWGSRFRYTYGIDDELPIYESIENLDRKAMELIESLCPEKFNSYLKKTKN